MSKAFDRINYNLLLLKLQKTSLPSDIIMLLRNMLENTYVNVKYDRYVGEEFKVLNGVRQGGILSTLLFNFYIDEAISKVSEMAVGCRLFNQSANIIAYADDILLVAPSANSLQILINELQFQLEKISLVFNATKSSFIFFKYNKKQVTTASLSLGETPLKQVYNLPYLGVIISDDFSLNFEIDRALKSFQSQFSGMYYKFNFTDRNVLAFLFKTYTSSFYGMNLWFEQILSRRSVHKLAVTYHKAVKKVAGLNVWDSNHTACERVGVNTFSHLLAKRMLKFYFAIVNSENFIFKNLRHFFINGSMLSQRISTLFQEKYEVDSILTNDLHALLARIDFVERHEPRSNYSREIFLTL